MRRLRRLGAITLSRTADCRSRKRRRRRACLAKGVARLGVDRLPWTKRCGNGVTACVSAPRRRRRLARSVRHRTRRRRRLAGGDLCRQDFARRAFRRRIRRRIDRAPALPACNAGSMPKRRRISRRRPARACRSTTRRTADRRSRSASRSCSASTAIRRLPAERSRCCRASFAGAPAGADDARSARLLARQLRRRARGDARPLSESIRGRTIRSPHCRHDGRERRRVAKGEPTKQSYSLFAIHRSLLYCCEADSSRIQCSRSPNLSSSPTPTPMSPSRW